jgi:hypothetical protein
METQTKFSTLEALSAHYLNQFYGTENWVRHPFSKTFFTDGFMAFMEKADAFWIGNEFAISLFAQMKDAKVVSDTYYVTWTVNEKEANGIITCEDYKGKQIWSKNIDYTDCIGGTIRLIAGWQGDALIMCLPSEN